MDTNTLPNPLTGWVTPPTPIRGLDHLGVQAPCIALYGQLLPGITNVTDRARYYSFYPWLVREFERRYEDRSKSSFCRVLRRAECLVALVAAYHEESGDERQHGAATVGRDKMRPAAARLRDDERVNLAAHAALEGDDRYFKNQLGGLGQYYFGSLRDLRVLDYVDGNRANPAGYDRIRGTLLADAFGASVDADRFFRVIQAGHVARKDAEALVAFCPCGLRRNEKEREVLLDLFFARTEAWQDEESPRRRATLALVLDVVAQSPAAQDIEIEGMLRGAAYSGHLIDGAQWSVPKAWARTRDGWGTYARNELFSVAMQGLFFVTLRAIDRAGGRIDSAERAGEMLREIGLSAISRGWRGLTVGAAVAELARELPGKARWDSELHEIQGAWRLVQESGGDDRDADVRVVGESIRLLLTLLARGFRDNPYADFDLDPTYFAPGDLHLLSLRRHAEEWMTWPLPMWLEWLGTRWGVERHLHVALRKLRAENRDTFRLRPLDGDLRLVEVPPVVFTTPRIGRAQQILRDLTLIQPDDGGWWVLTDRGRAVLEACRG